MQFPPQTTWNSIQPTGAPGGLRGSAYPQPWRTTPVSAWTTEPRPPFSKSGYRVPNPEGDVPCSLHSGTTSAAYRDDMAPHHKTIVTFGLFRHHYQGERSLFRWISKWSSSSSTVVARVVVTLTRIIVALVIVVITIISGAVVIIIIIKYWNIYTVCYYISIL